MNSVEFGKKLRPYNKQYKELFGYVPSREKYSCSQEEYFEALLKAIETRMDIEFLLTKKTFDETDPNKLY